MSDPGEKKSAYEGKKITCIGAMSKSRTQITQDLRAMGIQVVPTVTTKTDILLCSAEEFQRGTHVKYQKSKDLGIQIIHEDDFWDSFDTPDNLRACLDIDERPNVQNTFDDQIAKNSVSEKNTLD